MVYKWSINGLLPYHHIKVIKVWMLAHYNMHILICDLIYFHAELGLLMLAPSRDSVAVMFLLSICIALFIVLIKRVRIEPNCTEKEKRRSCACVYYCRVRGHDLFSPLQHLWLSCSHCMLTAVFNAHAQHPMHSCVDGITASQPQTQPCATEEPENGRRERERGRENKKTHHTTKWTSEPLEAAGIAKMKEKKT